MLTGRKLLYFLVIVFPIISWSQAPIIPSPMVYQSGKEQFSCSLKAFTLDTTGMPKVAVEQFQRYLKRTKNIELVFVTKNALIKARKLLNVPKDAYVIKLSKEIYLEYSTDASCFYACMSLIQLLDRTSDELTWYSGFLSDAPKYEWRGLHLDVSRHFFTVDEVKEFLDVIAFYKFNTFHWHLTDDQGWRIEIKKYPLLTQVGAWRDSTKIGHYSDSSAGYDEVRYGGYYTQEEIREVVRYAQNLSINVVPEIEMPGHARAALAAYPYLSCTGKQMGVPGNWGVFDDVFCTHESVRDFLKNVLSEVCDLFPSPYIHIGGDETPKKRWLECPKCKKVMRENGLASGEELQSFFFREMDGFLAAKGKKLVGWDEILEGGLSENAVVMSWRGTEGAKHSLAAEHDVVLCPGSHCYFDHYQQNSPNEPLAIGGYTPLDKVFSFRNVLAALDVYSKNARVLGAQANLWTEYITDKKKLMYMTYPRALAMSECLWSGDTTRSFVDFKRKLENWHYTLLTSFQVAFCGSSTLEMSPKLLEFSLPASKGQVKVYQAISDKEYKGGLSMLAELTDGKHATSTVLAGNWWCIDTSVTVIYIRFEKPMSWSKLGFSIDLEKENTGLPLADFWMMESRNSKKWHEVDLYKNVNSELFWLSKLKRRNKKVREIKLSITPTTQGLSSLRRNVICVDELIIK